MPPFPDALGYLWRCYIRLRRRTAGGFAGPQPIGWHEMDAFLRLSRISLAPWEIETLEALDELYMNPTATAPLPEGQVAAASASNPAGVRAIMASVGNRRFVKREGR